MPKNLKKDSKTPKMHENIETAKNMEKSDFSSGSRDGNFVEGCATPAALAAAAAAAARAAATAVVA